MKVLFLMINYWSPTETWMRRMISYLQNHLDLIGCYSPLATQWEDKIPILALNLPVGLKEKIAIRILRFLGYSKEVMPSAARKLKERLLLNKDLTVLVNYIPLSLQLKAVWAQVPNPVFIHCHGYDITWDSKSAQTGLATHPKTYRQEVLKLSKRPNTFFIANSQFTANILREAGLPSEAILVKYFGVKVDPVFQFNSNGRINILFVGRLVDFKGPDVVLRAFLMARSKGMNATLDIVGDGHLMKSCVETASRSLYGNDVKFHGYVDVARVESLIATCDIFTAHNQKGALTNQQEAFGVSIIEAFGQGKPFVGTRDAAIPEIVTDRVCGILVQPGDEEAHAEAFLLLANDVTLRQSLGQGAWRRARDLFSLEGEEKRMKEILKLN